MRNGFKLLFLSIVFFFAAIGHGVAQTSVEQGKVEERKIEYLINEVATLHDAHFIRNGTEYDSAKAADHLRLKRRNAGSRVKTADEFIKYCATESSQSGEKYRIRFASGQTVEAAAFLREKLAAYKPD